MTNEKGPSLEPILVLMRHAARDFSDDGLSPAGELQALSLREILMARGLTAPMRLESSPKRRTRATLRHLAETTDQKISVNTDLDERNPNESALNFEARVKKFCDDTDQWAEGCQQLRAPLTAARIRLACSHLDWLEAAARFLSSDESDLGRDEPWPAMSLRIYGYQNGIWRRKK